MLKGITTAVALGIFCAVSLASAQQNVRVKDVAALSGVEDVQIFGYGLVVGLDGTGDRSQTVFTQQTVRNMLKNMGIEMPDNQMRLRNVGAVMVSAPVPPVLSGAGVLTGGGFALTGTGTAGQAYVLLGASNLVPPVVWLPLATNSADTNGSINFNDPQAVNRSQRFYRLTTP